MCSCHSILECCVTFSGVKLSIRSFVLFIIAYILTPCDSDVILKVSHTNPEKIPQAFCPV